MLTNASRTTLALEITQVAHFREVVLTALLNWKYADSFALMLVYFNKTIIRHLKFVFRNYEAFLVNNYQLMCVIL